MVLIDGGAEINIVSVARTVQDKVMSLVQASTGIEQAEVNVHVSGISFEK